MLLRVSVRRSLKGQFANSNSGEGLIQPWSSKTGPGQNEIDVDPVCSYAQLGECWPMPDSSTRKNSEPNRALTCEVYWKKFGINASRGCSWLWHIRELIVETYLVAVPWHVGAYF